MVNVRTQPWGSGAFGEQLLEKWARWKPFLLSSDHLRETYLNLICWDNNVDPETIDDCDAFLSEVTDGYLKREVNYVTRFAAVNNALWNYSGEFASLIIVPFISMPSVRKSV